MATIELRDVYKNFGKIYHPAVRGLSFRVEKGEILVLLGPSGCGKTTTLRLIAGFEEPDSGTIHIDEKPVSAKNIWVPPEKRGVGMVFQDYALFPHLTVFENVSFGLIKMGSRNRSSRAMEILQLVGLMDFKNRYPYQLSGGQQQRIALARALAPKPVVVLLDEPFSNLDADMRTKMRQDVVDILRQEKSTSIFVTHDQDEAFAIADRVGILNHGRLEQLDTPENIYHKPLTKFIADFVGHADFIKGVMQGNAILTELGLFPYEEYHPEGTEMELMLRPDDVDIEPDNTNNVVIISRQFRGSENLYAIRLKSGQILHSTQPSTMVYTVGIQCSVKVKSTHIIAFKV